MTGTLPFTCSSTMKRKRPRQHIEKIVLANKIVLCIPMLLYIAYRIWYYDVDTITAETETSDKQNSKTVQPPKIERYPWAVKHVETDNTTQGFPHTDEFKVISNEQYRFNCSTIPLIKLTRRLGNGITKSAYVGVYRGQEVVLKMSPEHMEETERCVYDYVTHGAINIVSRCHSLPVYRIMAEIMMLHEIKHPKIVALLGYCLSGTVILPEGVRYRGILTVVELGESLPQTAHYLPWDVRLAYGRDIAEILQFFQNTQIGSLWYSDFKVDHFLVFNSTIKVIDFDMVTARDIGCNPLQSCEFDLQCIDNHCAGHAAKYNLKLFRDKFESILFETFTYPLIIQDDIRRLNKSLANTPSITADELFMEFVKIRNKALVAYGMVSDGM
ncbi:hypothetical protein ScPMuIL_000947 [Solemya velum]